MDGPDVETFTDEDLNKQLADPELINNIASLTKAQREGFMKGEEVRIGNQTFQGPIDSLSEEDQEVFRVALNTRVSQRSASKGKLQALPSLQSQLSGRQNKLF